VAVFFETMKKTAADVPGRAGEENEPACDRVAHELRT
jgi:hypothetical protein